MRAEYGRAGPAVWSLSHLKISFCTWHIKLITEVIFQHFAAYTAPKLTTPKMVLKSTWKSIRRSQGLKNRLLYASASQLRILTYPIRIIMIQHGVIVIWLRKTRKQAQLCRSIAETNLARYIVCCCDYASSSSEADQISLPLVTLSRQNSRWEHILDLFKMRQVCMSGLQRFIGASGKVRDYCIITSLSNRLSWDTAHVISAEVDLSGKVLIRMTTTGMHILYSISFYNRRIRGAILLSGFSLDQLAHAWILRSAMNRHDFKMHH